MTTFTIKSILGSVLWTGEAESLRRAVEIAARARADLTDADLTDADLTDAVLRGADLTGADLTGADLRGADLRGADLRGADLRGADLTGADLRGAVLRGAVLRGADLTGADLRGADLTDAVNIPTWLAEARDDVLKVLDAAPAEVDGLLAELVAGRVDGSVYTGKCACLLGTIAKQRGCPVGDLAPALVADSTRPAERFVMGIRPGHTPANSMQAALLAGWIAEWKLARAQAVQP